MSGGAFDYQQYHINEIADSIAGELERNNTIKSWSAINSWDIDSDTGRLLPNTNIYNNRFSKETVENLIKAYEYLRIGYELAHAADWFFSDDTGEDSFNEECKESIERVKKEVGDFADKVRNKEPEHLNRCIFCKNRRYVNFGAPMSFCSLRKSGDNEIHDPMRCTCDKFDTIGINN